MKLMRTWIRDQDLSPDVPTVIERCVLRELVDDEELWFYQPEMERCRAGDIFRVSEMPKITARPPDPSEPVRFHCKDLFV